MPDLSAGLYRFISHTRHELQYREQLTYYGQIIVYPTVEMSNALIIIFFLGLELLVPFCLAIFRKSITKANIIPYKGGYCNS